MNFRSIASLISVTACSLLPFFTLAQSDSVAPQLQEVTIAVEAPSKADLPATPSQNSSRKNIPDTIPKVVHPEIGESVSFGSGKSLEFVARIQNYGGGPTRDADLISPKSVNIHPSGKKFYVNALESGKTLVYALPSLEKIAVIRHSFNSSHASLWAPPSGLFEFRHYTDGINNFLGKPVESAFSHDGRFLWIPYYRRSFDLNAQDPSALAVIDTRSDAIVRLMEAGVLPKMVAVSPNGNTIAIAHWGDNTVGLIDASSDNPSDWKYIANIAVGCQLFHDFSLTESVDRDKDSGEALRGSVFTPDDRYLLVGCMSGGGIAVIDVEKRRYLGKLFGMMPNVRHLVIKDRWLYASINIAGYVQRVPLEDVTKVIDGMPGGRNATVGGWQTVKVAPGARTLELSPAGDFIFVACNFGSMVCVVDSSMRKVAEIQADSYPVGLDVSPDGHWLITTSQGRKNKGGHAIDIFSLTGLSIPKEEAPDSLSNLPSNLSTHSPSSIIQSPLTWFADHWMAIAFSAAVLLLLCLLLLLRRHRQR